MLSIAFVEVRWADLLILVLLRIDGKPGEALCAKRFRYGVPVAFRFAIVGQLKVGVRVNRRGAAIAHLQRHIDDIAVALELEDFLYLNAIFAFGAEAQLYTI